MEYDKAVMNEVSIFDYVWLGSSFLLHFHWLSKYKVAHIKRMALLLLMWIFI